MQRDALAAVVLTCVTGMGTAHAQLTTEQERISYVQGAVARTGYASPVVVSHGDGPLDRYWALTAMRSDTAVLVVVRVPGGDRGGGGPWPGIVLERAKTPADLNLAGVSFAPFLGTRGLVIVRALHHPFMLETTHTSTSIHVLRDQEGALAPACELDGEDVWSTSKGVIGQTTKHEVTIVKVPGNGPLTFDVTRVESAFYTNASDIPPKTKTDRQRYELGPTGMCRALPPG